jgi:Flp pilus assembly protein CpaB
MTRKSFVALFTVVALSGIAVGLSIRRPYRCSSSSLVPVVVASVDIAAGTRVTFDMISQRSVPEQFVTSSIVKPDSASYVVNQVIDHPMQAGDPLRWVDFQASTARHLSEQARAVRVETGEGVMKGDHLDLWRGGAVVASDAEVLDELGATRWVKVSSREAEMIARSSGAPTVVLRPR